LWTGANLYIYFMLDTLQCDEKWELCNWDFFKTAGAIWPDTVQ